MCKQIEVGPSDQALNRAENIFRHILDVFVNNPSLNIRDSLNVKIGHILDITTLRRMLQFYPIVYTSKELVVEPTLYEFMLHIRSCVRDAYLEIIIKHNQYIAASEQYLFFNYPKSLTIKEFAYRNPKWYNEIRKFIKDDASPELRDYFNNHDNSINDVLTSLHNYTATLMSLRDHYMDRERWSDPFLFGNNIFGIDKREFNADVVKHKNANRLPTCILSPIPLTCDRHLELII